MRTETRGGESALVLPAVRCYITGWWRVGDGVVVVLNY